MKGENDLNTLDWSPLWISLRTATASTFLTFFSGLAAAQAVARYKGRFKGLIDSVLTLPMILPPTVVGFFLLVLLGKYGPIGSLLNRMGTRVIFSWSATVIAAAVVSFPLMYKAARGAFEQIDDNIISAARTLGVHEWRIFWRLSIPMVWPGIAAGTALAFARALGEFGATLMVAGNMPGKTQTIPIAIYFAVQSGEYMTAYLWAGCIFLISLITMSLMNRWTNVQSHNRTF